LSDDFTDTDTHYCVNVISDVIRSLFTTHAPLSKDSCVYFIVLCRRMDMLCAHSISVHTNTITFVHAFWPCTSCCCQFYYQHVGLNYTFYILFTFELNIPQESGEHGHLTILCLHGAAERLAPYQVHMMMMMMVTHRVDSLSSRKNSTELTDFYILFYLHPPLAGHIFYHVPHTEHCNNAKVSSAVALVWFYLSHVITELRTDCLCDRTVNLYGALYLNSVSKALRYDSHVTRRSHSTNSNYRPATHT